MNPKPPGARNHVDLVDFYGEIMVTVGKYTIPGWWFFTNHLVGGFSPTHLKKYAQLDSSSPSRSG